MWEGEKGLFITHRWGRGRMGYRNFISAEMIDGVFHGVNLLIRSTRYVQGVYCCEPPVVDVSGAKLFKCTH